MALLEDLANGVTPTGFVAGLGAALLVPVLRPATSQVLRPVAKAVLRTSITLYRSTIEPISAAVGELVTEAQLELAASSAKPARAEEAAATGEPAGHDESRSHKNRKART